MFSQTKVQIGINIFHIACLQFVRMKPHSFSLTNGTTMKVRQAKLTQAKQATIPAKIDRKSYLVKFGIYFRMFFNC